MKLFILGLAIALSGATIGQDIQHEATAVNIEVSVRVFDRGTFFDNLGISDFEVYEDGVLQSVEAVYLIKKVTIEKEDEPKDTKVAFEPKVGRHFILVFETINWIPKIDESVDYFFSNVFQPEDSLVLITPVKSYNLSRKAIENMPKEKICAQFKSILRKEILSGNREYKDMFRDYKRYEELKRYGRFDPEAVSQMQRTLFHKMKDYKYFDEEKLSVFADYLKDLEGPKHIFLFYQKEEIPFPEDAYFIQGEQFTRDVSFDVNRIKEYFSDSSITTHFLYLTNKAHETIDVENREDLRIPLSNQSYQIFSAFNEVSKTTGGITYASANPFAAFKRAADASENYYSLFYTPKDYKSDGKFHNIKVRIKDKSYKVLHRAGYLAD
jgi:hypothetical protein